MADADPRLQELEQRMAGANLRGQWQIDANRPQNVRRGANGQVFIEPMPAGIPHVWRWKDMQQMLQMACQAMTESNTARRALMFTNPKLQRGTVQNLVAGMQAVKAGEIAWAHRHTINALRFAVQGGEKVFTVVDGRPLPMESYDLILTPGWSWHDHHNESDRDAIWVDALDVPFTVGMNLNFYEEPGDIAQEQNRQDSLPSLLYRPAGATANARPFRYPWQDTLRALKAQEGAPADPYHGQLLEYVNPLTGGPALPTIKCQIQVLPPGFAGRPHRTTSSSIAFIVQGEGRTVFSDKEIDWGQHDAVAIPNWSWHRHVNASKKAPAILFTLSDSPILSTLGFLREETEDSAEAQPPAQAAKLTAAE
ncbi:MAG TPA: cupin domain-containing protein [Xanthobacteraceae bacterium]|nr:cupin domain-containing protein [Xanthobacteraceae bacterium]